jgi:hypothetical protein
MRRGPLRRGDIVLKDPESLKQWIIRMGGAPSARTIRVFSCMPPD